MLFTVDQVYHVADIRNRVSQYEFEDEYMYVTVEKDSYLFKKTEKFPFFYKCISTINGK